MTSWFENKARRIVVAGAIAFAVGAPTIACMGGGTTTEPDDGDQGGEKGEEDDGAFDPAKAAIGTWRINPGAEELRIMKILHFAMDPKGSKKLLQDKLDPDPTQEEMKMFNEVHKLAKQDPNNPDLVPIKAMIQMMREARLDITEDKYILKVGGDTMTYSYKVTSKSDKEMTVSLDNGKEKHHLTFKDDDTIKVKIQEPMVQELTFKRA